MADTNFSDQSSTVSGTSIVAAWLNAVNKWLFWGRRPNIVATTGSANAQVLTLEAGSLYVAGSETDGDEFWFSAGFTNTGAMTLQVLALSGANVARAVQLNGQALTGGEVQSGALYKVQRLGTTWQLAASKQLLFAGLTAQRTLTLPDANLTLAGPTAARTLTIPDANLTIPAVTAKGDTLAASSSGVLAKVTAGADGLPLVTDSAQTPGVKWGFSTQTANTVYAGPSSGAAAAPAFRALVPADLSMTPITNSLSGDVALNNTANYFDGPSVAQGTVGTWFVSGTITVQDTGISAAFVGKLWDGTTVISSERTETSAANQIISFTLSGYITNPAGNLRISVKDPTATTGKMLFNVTGNSKDCTISAFRIG